MKHWIMIYKDHQGDEKTYRFNAASLKSAEHIAAEFTNRFNFQLINLNETKGE